MQDLDSVVSPDTGESSEDSSDTAASDMVRIEPVVSNSPGGTVGPVLVLDHPPFRPLPGRLVTQTKAHAQLILGLVLGTVATLSLGQFSGSSPVPTRFYGLGISPQALSYGNSLAFPGALRSPPATVAIPKPPTPVALPKPVPQLKFIDRYYFTDGPEQAQPAPAWFMVDRFYFSNPAGQLVRPPAPPEALNQPVPAALAPFLPPALGGGHPPGDAVQGLLEVPPPPPNFDLSSGPQPVSAWPDTIASSVQMTTSVQGQHTLLGVVKTNQFGAALVKTNGSSYSVRVGDALRHSRYVLTALDQDKAVLNDGQRTLTITVGETF